jgi:hypothetical protein
VRSRLPLAVSGLVGFFMLIQFFVPHPASTAFYETILEWIQIVWCFALVLGITSIVRHHTARVKRGQGGGYSMIALVSMGVMTVVGLIWGRGEGSPFDWLFQNMQVPLQSTMFSLLAFFIVSAAYRGFRARSTQATVLLVAGCLVMLGRVPLGTYFHPRIPWLASWVLDFPSMAARRGIYLGIGLGTIATSLRVITGLEQAYLGKTGS